MEVEFLGEHGRPISRALKQAISTVWAVLKPIVVIYMSVKMFWPSTTLLKGVPE